MNVEPLHRLDETIPSGGRFAAFQSPGMSWALGIAEVDVGKLGLSVGDLDGHPCDGSPIVCLSIAEVAVLHNALGEWLARQNRST